MRGFMRRMAMFMQGRYGSDRLNIFLYAVFLVIWFINIFVTNTAVSLMLDVLELAAVGYSVFRSLSRNISARAEENRRFSAVYEPAAAWLGLTFRKIKDHKDYRYIKCPMCKAQLRVKNKKGNHTVRCPKCGSEFDKKI